MRRILSLIFALTIIVVTALSAQAATPRWRLQDMPSPPQGVPSFSGVSCPTTTVCVAVGSVDYFDSGGHGHTRQAIERWQGGKWAVQSTPAAVSDSLLTAVSCASTTSCLAVGSSIMGSTGHPLIERYSAGHWTVLSASTIGAAAQLESVSCSATTLCTAVGVTGANAPLIERWSTGTWHQQQAPQATSPAQLSSVSCAVASSCMAVGSQQNGIRALAYRWNGKAWTTVVVPAKVGNLRSVSCATSTVCTAVAEQSAVRWTGSGPVTSAIPLPSDLAFLRTESISCPTAEVCEFAGGYVNTNGDDFTTAARLAAGKWTRQSPDNSGFDMDFQAISCSTAVTCEAVGSQSSFGLAERYS